MEVRITPQELAILSFPGADRSIRMADLQTGRAISRRYRNRRIGAFLKELDLAEGRSTGIPKILRAMRANGSPAPVFESDDDRTWFLVRLPAHRAAHSTPTVQGAEQDDEPDPVQVTEHDIEHGTPQVTRQVTPQVTGHVMQLVAALSGQMSRGQMQETLGPRDRSHFTGAYLRPAVEAGLIEMTLPDKPRSQHQRYRRTAAGEALAQQTRAKGPSA